MTARVQKDPDEEVAKAIAAEKVRLLDPAIGKEEFDRQVAKLKQLGELKG